MDYKQKIKVMLVDDEENILKSIRRSLIDENFQILTACSGDEALNLLNEHPDVALIISDQRMPGMSGIEFLSLSRSVVPHAFRILLTGFADVEAAINSINMSSVFRFILKPWDSEVLLEAVHSAIELYIMNSENIRLNALVTKQNLELKAWNTRLEQRVKEQTSEITEKNQKLLKANKDLLRNFNSSLEVFSSLMESRDPLISNHSKNVADLTYLIAKKMMLTQEEAITAKVAALLHDIGKIGVSDTILQKHADDYTKDELFEYQKHSVRGQMAIDSIEELRKAGVLIRHHHEAFDGSGFPDGLSGEQIPVGGRIICVSDFIDNEIWTLESAQAVPKVLEMVKHELGKRFDPLLFTSVEESVKEHYSLIFLEENGEEIETDIDHLRPGMVLSRDLHTGTGILLEVRGATIDAHSIASIKRYLLIDPSGRNSVFIKNKV